MPEVEYDPAPTLGALVRHGVDFVLIGGLAGIARGSAYNTHDTDVAYSRSRDISSGWPARWRSSAPRCAELRRISPSAPIAAPLPPIPGGSDGPRSLSRSSRGGPTALDAAAP